MNTPQDLKNPQTYLNMKRYHINSSSSSESDNKTIISKVDKKELDQLKLDTLELVEMKDNQINSLEMQVSRLEKKLDQMEKHRDLMDSKLDESRKSYWKEREAGKKLYYTMKDAINKIDSLVNTVHKKESYINAMQDQLGASQVVINDLSNKLDMETEKADKCFKITMVDNEANDADDIEEADIIIKRANFTFNAIVKPDNNLPFGECSYCFNHRYLVKNCCSLNVCNKCYFKAGNLARNGVMIQLGCDLCKKRNDIVQDSESSNIDDYDDDRVPMIRITNDEGIINTVRIAIENGCITLNAIAHRLRNSLTFDQITLAIRRLEWQMELVERPDEETNRFLTVSNYQRHGFPVWMYQHIPMRMRGIARLSLDTVARVDFISDAIRRGVNTFRAMVADLRHIMNNVAIVQALYAMDVRGMVTLDHRSNTWSLA